MTSVAQRVDQPVDVLGGGAEPDARPDRGAVAAGARVPAEPLEQRVGAEPAVAHADPVLGRQVGGDVSRGVTRDREALHRHAVRRCRARSAAASRPGPWPGRRRAGRAARARAPGRRRRAPAPACGRPARARRRRARSACPPRAGAARAPTSAPSRSTCVTAPPPARYGRRGVEPVAAADERSRAVGRVELVPGQRDVVDARSRRGRRGGAGRAARRRRRPARPPRGRSRRSGRSGSTSPVTLDAPVTVSSAVGVARSAAVERGERLLDRARPRAAPVRSVGRATATAAGSRGARRRGTAPAPGTAVASRFSASVVLRVNTTTSSLPGPDELADALAGPLQQRGADLREVARAAVHARQQRQDVRDVRGDRLQSRRAGGEVEVGVVGRAAGDQRDPRPRADGPGEGRRQRGGRG